MTKILATRQSLLIAGAGLLALATVFFLTQMVLANVSGTLLPNSDGAYLQWTPKTGSTHYTMVDEATCNGTTDYNYTNTVGSRDSYGVNISSLPSGSIITAIEITPCASRNKNGGSASVMNVFYRWNGSNSTALGSYSLTGTTPIQLSPTTWSGLSLYKGVSSSLQIGSVLSAGTKGARLGRISVVLTYTSTPPAAPSNLTATASSSDAVLDWNDNSNNEDGFRVERSIDGVNFSEIAVKPPNFTSHIDPVLAPGTYWYRVRAYNAIGNSAYSNIASVVIS